jgi:predicted small lipoprotein YifL
VDGLTAFAGVTGKALAAEGRVTRRAALLLLGLTLPLAACGKKGDPIPPPGEPNTYPRTYPRE